MFLFQLKRHLSASRWVESPSWVNSPWRLFVFFFFFSCKETGWHETYSLKHHFPTSRICIRCSQIDPFTSLQLWVLSAHHTSSMSCRNPWRLRSCLHLPAGRPGRLHVHSEGNWLEDSVGEGKPPARHLGLCRRVLINRLRFPTSSVGGRGEIQAPLAFLFCCPFNS